MDLELALAIFAVLQGRFAGSDPAMLGYGAVQ